MPIIKNCKICHKEFNIKPCHEKAGYGVYCSRACHYGDKKGNIVQCSTCGTDVYKTIGEIKRSKSKKYFCDKSCQTKWRNVFFSKEKHANWKDGSNSYRSVMRRSGTPQICKLCGLDDSRVLAVHHIDKNRKNNKLDNLVWLCHNCHHLVHYDNVTKKKLMEVLV